MNWIRWSENGWRTWVTLASQSEFDKSALKVVHIVWQKTLSGAPKIAVEIVSRLPRDRFEPTLIGSGAGEVSDLAAESGVPFVEIPELDRALNPVRDAKAFWKLVATLRRLRPHIVHTHSTKTGLLGRFAARLVGVPVIVHTIQGFAFHEFSSGLSLWVPVLLERFAGRATTCAISVNEHDRLEALRHHILRDDQIRVIPNGIDVSEFDGDFGQQDAPEILGIESERQRPLIVGSVARLSPQKNLGALIRALPRVLEQIENVVLVLAGEGPEESNLQALAEELGVSERCVFLRWREDIPAVLHALDVFVLPSLWEGLPLTVLEAMASRVPVVATDIKGNREAVTHGDTGLLVPPNDADALAGVIIRVLSDKSLARGLVTRAYQMVVDEYEVGRMVERIAELYDELLGSALCN